MKSKTVIMIANTALCVLTAICLAVFLSGLEWWIQAVTYVALGALCVCGVVFFYKRLNSPQRITLVISAMIALVVACFVALNLAGVFESFSDMDKIKSLILSSGGWGRIVFVLVQILQVVVLPAPGAIFYVLGTQIYGAAEALLLSSVGVVIGSVIAFSLGKVFGKTVVVWCIGREATDKYATLLAHKGKVLFILMQLLPFFPDDVLCMVAGLTRMSYPFFIAVMVLVRPIYIALVCYLGTGDIIPFSGWGIPVWIAIFAVIAVLFVLYTKHQDRIERWMRDKFSRKSKPDRAEQGVAPTVRHLSGKSEEIISNRQSDAQHNAPHCNTSACVSPDRDRNLPIDLPDQRGKKSTHCAQREHLQ